MRQVAIAVVVVVMLIGWTELACAQHGDYPLGTLGLLGASQAPLQVYLFGLALLYNPFK